MYSDELELVALSVKGDRRAYEELYRANVGKIYALTFRLCGQRELAEDLTQEAFVKAWQKLGSFKGESAFSSWLYRLTSNLVISFMRQQVRWKMVPMENNFECEVPGRDYRDEHADLDKAITALPDQARTVLVLYEYIGYQHNEISELTGLAIGTCKAHLHRARRLLKERMVV